MSRDCKNCGLAPMFDGCDDCVACTAAYLLTDAGQLATVRRVNAGTTWLRQLETEIARQSSQPLYCGAAINTGAKA